MSQFKNLPSLVFNGIKDNKEFVCSQKIGSDWHYYKSNDFIQKVKKLAIYLHKSGIKKGDKIAIHAKNSPDWLITDLAIMSIGAISVPIYTTQSSEHIKMILEHSKSKALFVSDDNIANRYKNIDISSLLKISFENDIDGFSYIEELTKDIDDINIFDDLLNNIVADDLAMISYTSGTTGNPKGVMLSHGNMIHSVTSPMKRCFFYQRTKKGDCVISFLPFTHIFEHAIIYGYLSISIPVYVVSDIDMIATTLEEKKPVHFTTVPRFLEKIYADIFKKITLKTGLMGKIAYFALKYANNYDINNKRSILHIIFDKLVYKHIRQKLGGNILGISSGGAALSPDIMRFFNSVGIPVAQGYGLTETAPCLTVYERDNLILGSVGTCLDNVKIDIADDGEIKAKGPNIMKGYYKDKKSTDEVIKDGWFYTGDIGYVDDNGFLFITDRKKELLKLSTGKYVAPTPIENKFLMEPLIEQILIMGDGQKFCSALIISEPDNIDELESNIVEIVKKVNKDFPQWERVKKWIISDVPMSIENGELTSTLKKKRKIILKNRESEIKNLYSENIK